MRKLVLMSEEYYDFTRLLRNANYGDGFIEETDITLEQQKEYMSKYGKDYYICLEDEIPVGFIGSIDNDIRIAVTPLYFGKGVGKFMLQELMKIYPKALAKIKVDNEASIKLFEKCGFKKKFYILEKE